MEAKEAEGRELGKEPAAAARPLVQRAVMLEAVVMAVVEAVVATKLVLVAARVRQGGKGKVSVGALSGI